MIILPSTAKAFSKREAVRIQLGTTDFPVLKNIRKLILQNGGPNLRSVGRQKTYLESILSSTDAIWTLCCLMLPVSSGSEYERWPDAPLWTSKDLLLSIEARVIDVYFSHTESGRLESHVLFKFTESTIEELFDYYEKVYLVEVASKYGMTPSIKEEAKKEFRQSLARFNFGPPIEVLEGLESDGTGELLEEWSGIVKDSLLRLLDRPTFHLSHRSSASLPGSSHYDLDLDLTRWYQQDHQLYTPDSTPTFPMETPVHRTYPLTSVYTDARRG